MYCHNNPINHIDPLGLKKKSEYEDDINNIEELKEVHHDLWKKHNKYDDASDRKKRSLDKKWDRISKGYDKAIDKIKAYIKKYDKLNKKYNDKSKGRFGFEPKDDWDDEYVGNAGNKEGPLGGERLDRMLVKEIGIGIVINFTTAGIGNIARAKGGLQLFSKLSKILLGGNKTKVFWSAGGALRAEEIKTAAEVWAKAHGATTLEMTRLGKLMDKIARTKIGRTLLTKAWRPVSKLYAQGAEGTAHVHQASTGIEITSAWAETEFKELSKKGVEIIYHNVK